VDKAPFDFVINVPEEKTRIICGVADDNKEQTLDRRIDEILSVSRIIKAYPVMITDGQKTVSKDISYIGREQFSKIKTAEDLVHVVT
jgi:predicted transcriptional regulator